MVTAEQVREALTYDLETGAFTWRVQTGKNGKRGCLAGTVRNVNGRLYRFIGLNRKQYPAHRLAWLYSFGHWPQLHIDHVDGDGLNNSLSNLREATVSENLRNRGKQANNKSGYKGVSWEKKYSKWKAQITVHGCRRHVGYYATREDAHAAYIKAAELLHGEFRRSA